MVLTPNLILDMLDSSASHDWPDVWGIAMTEYHAMRLIAVRSKVGDEWGIIFDSIRGSLIDDSHALGAGIWAKVYGSRVPVEQHLTTPVRHLPLTVPENRNLMSLRFDGIKIDGPAGTLRCENELIERFDLRPGRVCNLDCAAESPLDVILIRAYLAAFPGSLWPLVDESVALLGIDNGEVIVFSDAFHHVLGPRIPDGREDLLPMAMLPSASTTYRSLAAALSHRDATLFVPGVSNLDWRNWAVYTDENASLGE
jgi:hypothetical protein